MRNNRRRWKWALGAAALMVGVLGFLLWWQRFYQDNREYWGYEPYRVGVFEKRGETVRLAVISFYPREQRAEVVKFSEAGTLSAAGDYGEFSINNLYALDKQEKAEGEIITNTLTNNLGMWVRGTNLAVAERGKLPAINSPWIRNNLIKFQQTPQSKLAMAADKIRLWGQLLDLTKNQIEVIDLEKTKAWETEAADDQIGSNKFSPGLFDRLVSVHRVKLPQDVSVMVVNMTPKTGWGTLMARILERDGFNVIRVESNTNQEPSRSRIEVGGEVIDMADLSRLKLITGINTVEKKTTDDRMMATIWLGEDLNLD